MSPFWKRLQECSRTFRPFFLGTNSITIRTSEGQRRKTKTALFISCLLSTRTLFSSAKMCLACSYVAAEVRASFRLGNSLSLIFLVGSKYRIDFHTQAIWKPFNLRFFQLQQRIV